MGDNEKTLEEYISAIQQISETEEKAMWLKADLLLEAKEKFQGKMFANIMGEALGCTARYIQDLIKVAKTFSQEERLYHLPFTMYLICSKTKEPKRWIQIANDNCLSIRQLREEIKASKDTGDIDYKCKQAGDRLYRSISEFIEKYSESKVLWEQIYRLSLLIQNWQKENGA